MNNNTDNTQIEQFIKDVHKGLGYGRREKVYQHALHYVLNKAGIQSSMEVPFNIQFNGWCVGTSYVDIKMDTCLIEIKYVKKITDIHIAQLHAYMRDWDSDGILINYASNPIQIKHYKLSQLSSNTNN
tara:strand:- start:8954 stop:9337 length:384 start_codon:yes stop_codon:yes gene_type:complete